MFHTDTIQFLPCSTQFSSLQTLWSLSLPVSFYQPARSFWMSGQGSNPDRSNWEQCRDPQGILETGPCLANFSWYFRTLTGHATFSVYTDVRVTEFVGVSVLPRWCQHSSAVSPWVLCVPFWETTESLDLWKSAFSRDITWLSHLFFKKNKCIIYLF